jgi:hypothetical protein
MMGVLLKRFGKEDRHCNRAKLVSAIRVHLALDLMIPNPNPKMVIKTRNPLLKIRGGRFLVN